LFWGPGPQVAHAGFGPSSGATTSPVAGLTQPKVQDFDLLEGTASNKKLKQLIGSSLDERRLEDFNAQLDGIIEAKKKSRQEAASASSSAPQSTSSTSDTESTTTSSSTATTAETAAIDEDEMEKAQLLQGQIQAREKILAKLEAQPYWFNYLAAFCGSVASTLVMHPLDTIKTRLQLQKGKMSDNVEEYDNNSIQSDSNVSSNKTDIAVAVEEATTTEEAEEILLWGNLYEGLTGNIWKEGPPSALYLGVYESVKYTLVPKFSAANLLLVYLIAGAAGELVGSTVRAPAEAVKSLVQSRSADTALQAAQRVLGTAEGRANTVRAWSSSLWRDVPFGAIQLAIFEVVKAYILNNPDIDFDSSTLMSEAIIGAFAGGCGALITNPTDVITTRIITQSTGENDNPLGVVGMGKKIYQDEGPGAFFTGWQARVGYWAPAISIFLTCYCSVRQAGIRYDFFS